MKYYEISNLSLMENHLDRLVILELTLVHVHEKELLIEVGTGQIQQKCAKSKVYVGFVLLMKIKKELLIVLVLFLIFVE